ncbi:MAG: outer membrane beta-barrel protein [Candidatus Acidiferrales bacterium]
MKKLLARAAMGVAMIAGMIAAGGAPASGQTPAPEWQIGGSLLMRGYQNPYVESRDYTGGGLFSTEYTVIPRWLSAELQLDATYSNHHLEGNGLVASAKIGPQIYPFGHRKVSLYGHILFGEGFAVWWVPRQGGYGEYSRASNALAWQPGIGVDYAWKPHWNIRVLQFDYESTKFFGGNPGQGNYLLSTGLTYHWGEGKAPHFKKPHLKKPHLP